MQLQNLEHLKTKHRLLVCFNEDQNDSLHYTIITKFTKDLFKVAKEADLLIHDGTFIKMIKGREHACAKDVAREAKKAKVKKLVLTHISRRIKTSKEVLNAAKPIFKNTIVAEDMKRIKI